jgi:hypothetical protein
VVASAVAGYGSGVLSKVHEVSQEAGKSSAQLFLDFIRVRSPKSTGTLPSDPNTSSLAYDPSNWSGVWFSATEQVYAFVVDQANRVQWFFDTPCCTHVFIGTKSNGIATGRMYRRVKANACVTEYLVSEMKLEPNSTTHLTSTLDSQPACDVGPMHLTRVFSKKW